MTMSGSLCSTRTVSFSIDSEDDCIHGNVDVVINAGYAGSAWSGGDAWKDDELVSVLTQWTYNGGVFIGVNEPSAVNGYDTYFRMVHVLGIDEDTGARICHGKWSFKAADTHGFVPDGACLCAKENRYITDKNTKVILADGDKPVLTVNDFGKGKGIYLSSFHVNNQNTRLLYQLIRYAGGEEVNGLYMTDNADCECAYYPGSNTLVVINNSGAVQQTKVAIENGERELTLEPYETKFVTI